MNLVKDIWSKEDGQKFNIYLKEFELVDKVDRTKRIVNTKMNVLAIPTPQLRKIAKDIQKGNYFQFLNLNLNNYYENTIINGILISGIDDFELMKKYLDQYSIVIDNWASCDLLKFKVQKKEENYYKLSLEYVSSERPFVRRIGLLILFSFINNDMYMDKIFDILDNFKDETEYYVNMIIAWLCAECYIKRRKETLTYLKEHNLNKFVVNKFVSKCRDSYRVSESDKEMLLKYRVKN